MNVILVLIVCLSTTPDVCHEERPLVDLASPMGCLLLGERIGADWIAEHPKWRLDRWRCESGPRQQPT